MPAPVATQIESPAKGFFQAAGLQGEAAPSLTKALSEGVAQTLSLLLAMGMVMPGIPTAVDPISGSGSTIGMGSLMPPPTGGPGAQPIEGMLKSLLAGQGLRGEYAEDLAKAVAASIAQAITLFTHQSKVLPGIAVAGFVSTSPGRFMPVPLQTSLEASVNGFLQQHHIAGEYAPDLAKVIAQTLDLGFSLFTAQVMVAPGIACPPGATTTPGKFM
ncbi:hypothetical protein [Thiolinea disciformis]|uniref:hypothetical protein n=1 Tax=Thiolinea disciformis TaxID=125614 RepID=UPI0003614E29|nr:hypothetical protein [Thiolinea disciformis]